MDRFFTPHLQRFTLRVLFGAGAFLWSVIGTVSPNLVSLHILILFFLVYSVVVFLSEKGRQGVRREHMTFAFVDILFVGVLIALSGGARSEMHLLLYFVVAMRAPYRSWSETFMIPGVATLVDIAAVGQTFREAHWFDFVGTADGLIGLSS